MNCHLKGIPHFMTLDTQHERVLHNVLRRSKTIITSRRHFILDGTPGDIDFQRPFRGDLMGIYSDRELPNSIPSGNQTWQLEIH